MTRKKSHLPTPQALAEKFSELMRIRLPRSKVMAINRLNAAELNPNICHSHDFCDANMVMLDAGKELDVDLCEGISEENRNGQKHTDVHDLWNKAWGLAQKAQFGVPTRCRKPIAMKVVVAFFYPNPDLERMLLEASDRDPYISTVSDDIKHLHFGYANAAHARKFAKFVNTKTTAKALTQRRKG